MPNAQTAAAIKSAETSLSMVRHFNAPPERVFDAWLDPKLISKWIGPRVVQAEATKLEPRVGGSYSITMHTPTRNLVVSGIYTEIVRPHRLIFTFNWEHETQRTLVNLTFRPVGNGTEMTLVQTGFDNEERRGNHDEGWAGSFDKLADMLSNS